MTETFIVTTAWLSDPTDHHVNQGGMVIIMQSPSGQIEHGTVYPAHLDSTIQDHVVRRIRELFNVGLCHGYRDVYVAQADPKGRGYGSTVVYEMDFDQPRPWERREDNSGSISDFN